MQSSIEIAIHRRDNERWSAMQTGLLDIRSGRCRGEAVQLAELQYKALETFLEHSRMTAIRGVAAEMVVV